jgi:MFS family permease
MRARTRRPGPDDAGGHRKPASEPDGTASREPSGTAAGEPADTAPTEPGGTAAGKPLGGRGANSYLEMLRLPGALAFSASGFLARMPMSMFGLGTVLLIAAVTGRYGLAGLVAAVGSVGYALGAPQFARLSDKFGQRSVLRPQVAVFGAATVAFMTLAEIRAPLAAIIVFGALAGGTMPSVGSMVRARWSVLLAGTGRLHTAFSLESVADEIIFVVGPALVTLLATAVYPAAGLGAAMAMCVTGTLLFAAQRRTQPPLRSHPVPRGRTVPHGHPPPRRRVLRRARAPLPTRDGRIPPTPEPRRSGIWTAVPGLVTLVPVYWFLGAMFATIDLSTVAFAAEHGHISVAGLVLGTYAFGSAVGGLWYGTRHWRAPLERRFAMTLGCTVAGVATFWLMPGLMALSAVIIVAGLSISPTLIAGYGLIERQAPPERQTEGMTWLSSAISVGAAAGSPLAGHLIDTYGARWGYLLAAVCGPGVPWPGGPWDKVPACPKRPGILRRRRGCTDRGGWSPHRGTCSRRPVRIGAR